MRWLLFVARVAFICNLLFIVCLFLRYTTITLPEAVNGFIILAGWILSVFLNIFVNVSLLLLSLRQKSSGMPFWLRAFNLFLFLFQVFYFMLTV